ncbi:MAG: MaoC/PaaZ C-terminal domain-containing protein [Pseudomonadota bacterium]
MNEPMLVEGFEFAPHAVTVDSSLQQEKHRCCDIPTDLYGSRADLTHFTSETIMASKRAGVSINGSVHVQQVMDMREPIFVGETLLMSGIVTSIEPAPKGDLIRSSFEFRRADGSIPLIADRISLRLDPKRTDTTSDRTKPSHIDSATQARLNVGDKQLIPADVAAFSEDAENLIHSDPDVARAFGFRAPIAGGVMAIAFMMEVLQRLGPPHQVRIAVSFRRPMFWDDRLAIMTDRNDTKLSRIVILNADDKVVNRAVVENFVV